MSKKAGFAALALVMALLVSDCNLLQTENSFSGDALAYRPVSGSESFMAVNTIFVERCASCHSAFAGYSEQEWIDLGLVVAGLPTESPLIQRIRGAGVDGIENMPPDASLTREQIDVLKSWVSGL